MFKLLDLPPELVHEILVAVARSRSISRTLHVRLVSRFFASAITDALFASGRLGLDESDSCLFGTHIDEAPRLELWSRYMIYLGLSRNRSGLWKLQTLHRVAEAIAYHPQSQFAQARQGKEMVEPESQVRDCFTQLCCLPTTIRQRGLLSNYQNANDWNRARDLASPRPDFHSSLIAGAAHLDELDVVRDLVGSLDCDCDLDDATATAISNAASAGNLRIVLFLLSGKDGPEKHARDIELVILGAAWGNQPEIIEWALSQLPRPASPLEERDHFNRMHRILLDAMSLTTCLECFRRCYEYQPIVHGSVGCCHPLSRGNNIMAKAAGRGDLDMCVYMMASCRRSPNGLIKGEKDAQVFQKYFRSPLRHAARAGRSDVVEFLLYSGADPVQPSRFFISGALISSEEPQSVFNAAVQGGSVRCLELIVEAYDKKTCQLKPDLLAQFWIWELSEAFMLSVIRENEDMILFLLQMCHDLDLKSWEVAESALREAHNSGLESMIELLQSPLL
ncbi:hypothetical protein MCOR25_000855 [Pyricularia grisea]|uniref:Uncharacterized protein n=1 Tax=Pyricularia grisea TaxID=148305 RepID=A0A6P8B2Z9_PYRGI|nr:uncharacterized protein PgNI_06961 [Pyricularia grisea]KAI6382266.1 hypothetical protein MCOR25_000855 [Pyricularia grisea]TLD09241.1 hypothetical protein PgNI_06961 [Pyricularia grisea]